MSPAAEILSELRARGATVYRDGADLCVAPADVLPAGFRERLRAHKRAILELLEDAALPAILPDAPPELSAPGATPVPPAPDHPLEPGRCPGCGDRLPSERAVELCRACRVALRPDASLGLAVETCPACGERERWRTIQTDGKAWHGAPWTCAVCHPPLPDLAVERAIGAAPPPRYPLAVQVDAIEPAPAPLRLNAWTTVADVEKAVNADLASLRATVGCYSRLWSGSDDAALVAATSLGERIDELLERLAACGARVRVVAVQ